MKRRFTIRRSLLAAAGCACFCATLLAQDQPSGGQTPKPPAKAYGPIGVEGQDDQQPQPDVLMPDNTPLTGFQAATLGAPVERHSYWIPGISYYNQIQSNGQFQGSGGNSWNSTSYLTGNVSLLENMGRSQLQVNASGGGYFPSDSSSGNGNGWFTQAGLVDNINWERLQVTLLDQFSYLPEAQFGFGAGSGLAIPGGGSGIGGGGFGGGVSGLGGGLGGGVGGVQSIFTAIGPRYMNTAGVQTNYVLTRRSSITLGGIFSLLRFSDAGNIESNNYIGNAGYNYQISKNDTIGVVYRFSSFHYIGLNQAIGDHSIQAAYGRKITGRLALQLTGGPEITEFRIPQTVGAKTQFVSGSGSASLTYAFSRSNVSVSYFHGLTGGSGALIGATTDQVSGAASRRLTRVWSGDIHFGYARNHSAGTGSGAPSTAYDTVFAGASLARPFGRNASFSLGYTAYSQMLTSAQSVTTHQITLGFSWHTRPLVLQ